VPAELTCLSPSLFALSSNSPQAEIDDVLSKTVAELKLGTAPVISVREDDTALTTFQKIDSTGRSGVAVVNASNVLTGVTSSSDLKVRTLTTAARTAHAGGCGLTLGEVWVDRSGRCAASST